MFVAGFIGTPRMNFIDAVIAEKGGRLFAEFDKYSVLLPERMQSNDNLKKYITPPTEDGMFDEWYKKDFTFKKRYQIIVNLFDALRKIHLAGLIFTDLSPNNIMVHRTQNQKELAEIYIFI